MAKKLLFILGFAAILCSCGTMIRGTKQEVHFRSNPTGAIVYDNGQLIGNTPCSVPLVRKQIHKIEFILDGYQPYTIQLGRSVDWGWSVTGNLVIGTFVSLIGGVIGLAVDASNGAMYILTPSTVDAQLMADYSKLGGEDNLMLFVTMTPDPQWEKIGQLTAI